MASWSTLESFYQVMLIYPSISGAKCIHSLYPLLCKVYRETLGVHRAKFVQQESYNKEVLML